MEAVSCDAVSGHPIKFLEGSISMTNSNFVNLRAKKTTVTTSSSRNPPLNFRLNWKDIKVDHPYFAQRGLLSETVATFGLGFVTHGFLRNRIAIPVHDENSELVAYAGRWPGVRSVVQPNYKLPAGFNKSAELFNLHRAIQEPAERPLVVVEGFFDAIKLYQLGVRKVVALMGSILSPAQEELLLRHTSARSSIIIMLDEDDAGRFGREQMMMRLCTRLYVRVFKFDKEGRQPEHLTVAEAVELMGSVS